MVRNQFRIYVLAAALIGGAGLAPAAKIFHSGDDSGFNNLNKQTSVLPAETDPALEEARASAGTGSVPIQITTDAQPAYAQLVEPDCPPPSVPEPSTAALAGIGVVLLGLGACRRQAVMGHWLGLENRLRRFCLR